MSMILDSTQFISTSTQSPITFEHQVGLSTSMFTRYLTLNGKRAYELSFNCGTCYFLFELMGGAIDTVSVGELDELLREGVAAISPSILSRIAPIIPASRYVVNLVEITPKLVVPLATDDYFSHEQVALWGVDPFWGLPHYPRTEYYRSLTQPMGNREALFEFVVPMVPRNWLHDPTLDAFAEQIDAGAKPTAVAIAVLDIKQPAVWSGDPELTRHWCLAHFLLDGHHKMYSASQMGKTITLLSFLAIDESIADEDEIKRAVRLLSSHL